MTKKPRDPQETKKPGPVGVALRRLLDASGQDMRALSREAGLSDKAVQQIVDGESQDPKGANVLALARRLRVPLISLLDGSATPDMAGLPVDSADFVYDSLTHFLLQAWRELPEEERVEVLRYTRYRLAQIPPLNPPPGRKDV